jgi:predicted amidophosphoribosyltransferase
MQKDPLAGYSPLDLLFPKACLGCDAPLQPPVCDDCLAHIAPTEGEPCFRCGPADVETDEECRWCRELDHPPDRLCSLFTYHRKGKDLFRKAKYRGYWRLIPFLIEKGLQRFYDQVPFLGFDCIAPVPEPLSRRLTRHINPAALTARALSRRTGLPVKSLWRTPLHRGRQMGLSYAERRRNMPATFVPRGGTVPASVIIADDVVTTGATLSDATRTLREKGARRVVWLTIFRTPRGSRG